MDKDYIFKFNSNINFSKQNISREDNVIIVKLYRDYFTTDE